MDFFGNIGLRDTFQERIEIDMDKLPTKFSALNVDFNDPSLDFLGSRKPAHKGIKQRYPQCDTSIYHSQGGATELLLGLCDPDKEFGIFILT